MLITVEEEPRTVRSVVLAFAHVYRRRRLRANGDVRRWSYGAADCEADAATTLNDEEKENILRSANPMAVNGPVYAEWKEALLTSENEILRSLGFTLFWMPDSHPHKFILYFVRVLEVGGGGSANGDGDSDGCGVTQTAWNYCNDSCRSDLCVRYDP